MCVCVHVCVCVCACVTGRRILGQNVGALMLCGKMFALQKQEIVGDLVQSNNTEGLVCSRNRKIQGITTEQRCHARREEPYTTITITCKLLRTSDGWCLAPQVTLKCKADALEHRYRHH